MAPDYRIAPSILSADFARLGADTFVAGSAIFNAPDYAAVVAEMCGLLAEA